MHWLGSDVSGWGYTLMGLGMLLFWGLVIGGVVILVRRVGGAAPADVRSPVSLTPEQVLAGRFARGEIDEREFAGRQSVLHERGQS